jgi:peptidoglycan-N-acetylglucosamine deacetylase
VSVGRVPSPSYPPPASRVPGPSKTGEGETGRLPSPRSKGPGTHDGVPPGPGVGDEGRRPITLVVLLCATLLLGGCAAGSPSIVAPAVPESSSQVIPAVEAVPESAASRAAAPVVPAPEPAAPSIEIQPAAVDTTTEVAGAAAETLDPAAPEVGSSTNTAAFSQEVPAGAAPVSEPMLTGEDAGDDMAAPAANIVRPPQPPDPGTGLSTIVDRGTNGRLEVALTFDAGADTGYAAEILDLLREEGIKASFGMTGVWAEANPDLVRRMVAEGHQLINHTWDHSSLTGANTQLPPLSPEQVTQQLADTEAVVRDLTGGYEMRPYFRPPYGDYDAASLEYLYDNGYSQTIWWTCDSRGWAGWGAQEIIDYCTTNITEDEILLLHVGAAAVGDFEALPGLIRFFRESGYDFVTIEQMLQP